MMVRRLTLVILPAWRPMMSHVSLQKSAVRERHSRTRHLYPCLSLEIRCANGWRVQCGVQAAGDNNLSLRSVITTGSAVYLYRCFFSFRFFPKFQSSLCSQRILHSPLPCCAQTRTVTKKLSKIFLLLRCRPHRKRRSKNANRKMT